MADFILGDRVRYKGDGPDDGRYADLGVGTVSDGALLQSGDEKIACSAVEWDNPEGLPDELVHDWVPNEMLARAAEGRTAIEGESI